jgi:hypothetical protein
VRGQSTPSDILYEAGSEWVFSSDSRPVSSVMSPAQDVGWERLGKGKM